MTSTIRYGIDFGTSNSAISVVKDGRVLTLPVNPDSSSPEILESAIYFSSGQIQFGKTAIKKYLDDIQSASLASHRTLTTDNFVEAFEGDTKVKVHSSYDTTDHHVGRLIRSFKSALGASQIPATIIDGSLYTLEDIVAIFLAELRNRANVILKSDITSLNLGRPVKFVSENPKNSLIIENRLRNAAQKAGFTDVKFFYEPVAAAHSYGIDPSDTIFVFDFGGGTLDTTIMVNDHGQKKIVSTGGQTIGGDLLDLELYDLYLANYFGRHLKYRHNQIDYPRYAVEKIIDWSEVIGLRTENFFSYLNLIRSDCNSPETIDFINYFLRNNLTYSLRQKIVDAKISLSQNYTADLEFANPIKNISTKFDREAFNQKISSLLDSITELLLQSLDQARLRPSDITKVIMTGGSSYIPKVQSLIRNYFPNSTIIMHEPFTAVSKGLALME